jgi:rRNA maturation endonuclease Nob1
MGNIYVIDTSAVISRPDVVKRAKRHGVVIPSVVLRQLDGLKNSEDGNRAYWARKASQAIEEAQARGNVMIQAESVVVDMLDNKADNEIIGAAIWISRHYNSYVQAGEKVKDVILVSTDRNMRIAAANCGLKVEGITDRKMKLWRNILVGSFTLTGLSFVSLICVANEFIKVSDSTGIVVGIGVPVFLVISLVAAFKYSGYSDRHSGRKPLDDGDDDILLDPGCASIPGNIFHHYYER